MGTIIWIYSLIGFILYILLWAFAIHKKKSYPIRQVSQGLKGFTGLIIFVPLWAIIVPWGMIIYFKKDKAR